MGNNSLERIQVNKQMLVRVIACAGVILFSFIFIIPKLVANWFSWPHLPLDQRATPQSSFLDPPSLQGNPALGAKGIRFTIHPTGIDPKKHLAEAVQYRTLDRNFWQ